MTDLWLLDPHHDGSPLYVENQSPALGDVVGVRVFVPNGTDGRPAADTVVVRSVRDGEPSMTPAEVETVDDAGTWWRAPLLVHNPVTTYRFLLSGTEHPYRWLNAEGVHDRDVTDAGDFRLTTEQRLPDWVGEHVGYQVFPDRFARTPGDNATNGLPPGPVPEWAQPAAWDDDVVHRGPDVPYQWFGGTLDGVAAHLDHLEELGAGLLYLTPFFEARSNHRYDAASFDHVDPALGGDEALERLLDTAHSLGLRVVGDITTNHTGETHPWFLRALEDPDSEERGFYRFFDDGRYESWLGVASLPKLDHAAQGLRDRLYEGPRSVIGRWLDRGLDGWRVDVANMTGRLGADDLAHGVARAIRATIAATRPDAWLLAEHGHDASLDLRGDGWHGTMDYAGFTRPVWAWLNGSDIQPHGLQFLGVPVDIPVLPASSVVRTMREVHSSAPWSSWTGSTLHLDSHDTPRFRTVAGGGTSGWVDAEGTGRDRHLLGVALQMTLPGVPVVFMGDELGLTGTDGEHSRTPFPWARRDEWDEPTLAAYRDWITLRSELPALKRGGLRWVHAGDDSMTFLREHPEQRVLVHVARAEHEPVDLPLTALGLADVSDVKVLHGEAPVERTPKHLGLPSGQGAHVYVLP